MKWLKRNIRYFILGLFLLTNGLIIYESAVPGGPSGEKSSLVSLILSVFVNKNVKAPPIEYVPVESLNLSIKDEEIIERSEYFIPVGITRKANVTALPKNATDKGIKWTTSNSEALEVYPGGYLEARNLATKVLVKAASTSSAHTFSFYVTVKEKEAPPIYEASLNKDTITVGTTAQFNIEIDESVAGEYDAQKLTYYSEDESVAAVNNYGVVKGITPGETFVGVVGSEEKFKITVKANETPLIVPSSLTIDFDETAYVYDKIPLNCTFDTENVTDPSLTFVSSNDVVAKVIKEDGNYFIETPKIAGTATITAYLNTDFSISASKLITVKNVLPTSIYFKNVPETITAGSSINVGYDLKHSLTKESLNVTDKRVKFTSSDNSIARVSAGNMLGTIVAFKEGKVTITATSLADPTVSASFSVEIIARGYINDDNFNDFQSFVRKALGHFLLFFINGIFGFFTFYLFLKDKKSMTFIVIMAIITGVFVAALSEFIQLFVTARVSAITDILTDSLGYIIATLLMLLIVHLTNKHKHKKNSNN